MNVSAHLRKRLIDLLDDHRIVVWYDSEKAFGEFVTAFKAPGCVVVSATDSILIARRGAEKVYREMNESALPAARVNLLIYLPMSRGDTVEARQQDAFEAFAAAGTVFGVDESQRLASLARQAMPAHTAQITRLCEEGKPTLIMLDRLASTQVTSPLLHEVFGSDTPAEVIALALCDPGRAKKIATTEGCTQEMVRMLEAKAGFKPSSATADLSTTLVQLARYVLLGELELDSGVPLGDALSAISRAGRPHSDLVYAACDRMRTDTNLRDGYVELAVRMESDLRLASLTDPKNLGSRDTFPFEERRYLGMVIDAARRGDLAGARAIIEQRRSSIWYAQPERGVLWNAVARCVDLLQKAEALQGQHRRDEVSVKEIVAGYVADGGWCELDRRQRLFEHASASCTDDREIAPLLELCRSRYREAVVKVQQQFLAAVQKDGWPPEGYLRQTQIFDRFVSPPLESNEKVAMFMVDACRYEMGRDLGTALAESGEVVVIPAAGMLPSYTTFGMAALLPEADQSLRLSELDGELVPVLGTRVLRTVENRMEVLASRYGDRFHHVTLEEVLSKSKAMKEKAKKVDLLVVRTPDPDQIAENLGSLRARRYLSDITAEIATAVRKLGELGFQHIVIAADHGHVLVDEALAGETVVEPPGDWKVRKRRCLLGRASGREMGTIVFDANRVGIRGDARDYCVPLGYKTFRAGENYFHEGLSLQEAILPVVKVKLRKSAAETAERSIEIRYKRDYFTSRAIGLVVHYSALFPQPCRVHVEAYDGSSAKAKRVSVKTPDCDALDPTTHEIVLTPNADTPVPVQMDQDFDGKVIEIRVTDMQGVVWARKMLKNQMLD